MSSNSNAISQEHVLLKKLNKVILQKGELHMNGNGPAKIADRVYVGGKSSAKDVRSLLSLGITHVLNCSPGLVQTGRVFYEKKGLRLLEYREVDAKDSKGSPILDMHLNVASSLLKRVDQTDEGKLFIHCYAGCNRSVCLAAASLVVTRKDGLINVMRRIVKVRPQVLSNRSFREQLVKLAILLGLEENTKEMIMEKKESLTEGEEIRSRRSTEGRSSDSKPETFNFIDTNSQTSKMPLPGKKSSCK
jgi:hypothetical protein